VTSTAGTDEHPEVSEISALAEGILPPERSADLRGHLAVCVLCADVRDSLTEIRGLLGTLPGPLRMPEDVANRIDAALAAEALINATIPTPTASEPTIPAQAAPQATAAEGPTAEAGADASIAEAAMEATAATAEATDPDAVIAKPSASAPAAEEAEAEEAPAEEIAAEEAGTSAGISGTEVGASGVGVSGTAHVSRETSPAAGRPAGRPAAATGPGRATRMPRRRHRILTGVSAVAVLCLGGLVVHSLGADDQGGRSPGAQTVAVGAFSGVALPTRVHQLLGQAGHLASPGTGTHNTPFTVKNPMVPSCVLQATGRTDRPLATSKGSYQGHSSYLLVLPHPADPGKVDAYVVAATCAASGAASAEPGTVLAQRTYPRG
jgi:hypothetical protein